MINAPLHSKHGDLVQSGANSGMRANYLIRLGLISIDIANPIPKHCKNL